MSFRLITPRNEIGKRWRPQGLGNNEMTSINVARSVRRPAIVTGVAYLFLTSVMTMFRAYDAEAYIGKFPLYPGSASTIATQWAWNCIQIPLTAVIAVGLFRGWRWVRWFALTVFAVTCAISAPLRDVLAVPAYVFVVALNLAVYVLLFFAPSATVYFSRSTQPERAFTLRGAVSSTLLIFATFTAHSIGYATLWKKVDAWATWGSSAVFLLPALVLSALARWDLRRSAREISAALLAVTVTLASLQVTAFFTVHAWSPAVMRPLGWPNGLLLTVLLGITGLTLAAWAVRPRKIAGP
ncbi:hypothetical protein [Burkholderia vietnamiensis]|uniref:hypothetical protein n=1 Tax=Burkholderia vietnamiensis TaxID=60552 RepID=UPI002652343D|nr:hypothetical protein [Burkholderia vietnamiensis]MDN8039673.1 hypothetical protein [Burkholderia vietnamiensis]HDR9130099.1 hypothetical protein [Burkholderia vietnamiensis]